MSRGPGRVQRTICELIDDNPNGAWSTGELCWVIYNRVTKAKRVTVTRALRGMTLPGTWTTRCFRGNTEYWLCDPCNLASVKIANRCHPSHYEPGGSVYDAVEKAKRYRDASP